MQPWQGDGRVRDRFFVPLPVRRRLRIPGDRLDGAGHHLRDDGRHQPGAWRVHHLRRLCDRDAGAEGAAPAAGHLGRGGLRGGHRHDPRARHHPPTLPPAAGFHRRHLGHQHDRHPRRADRAWLDHAGRGHAAGQLFGRRLFLFDLPAGADGDCRPAARGSVPSVLPHPFRRDRPRDDPAAAHGAGDRSGHQPHLHPDLRPWRRAGRAGGRAICADDDAGAHDGQHLHRRKLRHRGDRRRGHLPWRGPGGGDPGGDPGRDDRLAGAALRADRPALDRDRRDPPDAGRAVRLAAEGRK